MLDIKIPHLAKQIKKQKDISSFLDEKLLICEKFDGTKLSLVRNFLPFDANDYSKNWIVSYKGSIIFPQEFMGVTEEMYEHSIGVCQYKRVFDFLKNCGATINDDFEPGTELFLEFIQNKHTLTRDYQKFGDLFLLQIDSVDFIETGMRIETISRGKVQYAHEITKKIFFKTPPKIFEGFLSKDEKDFKKLIDKYSNFESSLGGRAEGVVIHTSNSVYKIVAEDQYDKDVRKQKKMRYMLDCDSESAYWTEVRKLANTFASFLSKINLTSALEAMSTLVYSRYESKLPQNSKRNEIIRRDDLMLTSKMILEEILEIGNSSKVAVIPMAAYPFHDGHRILVSRASSENDVVILFVSTCARGEHPERIEAAPMLQAWKRILLPELPKNVKVRFSNSPLQSANQYVKNLSINNDVSFTFYGDVFDVNERWSDEKLQKMFSNLNVAAVGLDRETTVNVSGTLMRKWLCENHKKFLQNLPACLTDEKKMEYLEILTS